jgi:UDP-N-acetylglucosamine 2-epimerase (non-hydrolysing)
MVDDGRLRLIDPQGYLDFIGLVERARVVLTDSGGIQEETTILGVPCLTMRENTERPITITHGTNRLVGTDPTRIAAAWNDVRNSVASPQVPPLWDGSAAERIADVLERFGR